MTQKKILLKLIRALEFQCPLKFRCQTRDCIRYSGKSKANFFLCLIQRGSADASRQPAVRGLDGLAARKAEVIHPYFSRRSTHSCSLGKGPCSKNPPSSNASVINRIAGADSACRTICFPFKIEIFRNVFLSFLSQIKKIFAFFFSFPHLLKLQSCYIKISPKE